MRLGKADMAMLLMLVLCLATVVLGGASRPALLDVVLQWLPPMAMGRLLAQRLGLNWLMKAIGVVFAIAAALAVLEFATGINIFVLLSRGNSLYGTWGGLQARGGIVRAEGAFGHSIALGASLAAAMPLVLATDMAARAKSVIVLLLMAGTIVSFSRAGMICAVVGLVLTIVFQRTGLSARLRVVFTVVLCVVAFLALPYVSAVFEAAGQEAAGSAAYRGNLLSLIPDMAPLGISPAAYRAPDGTLYMSNFRSIDSTLDPARAQLRMAPADRGLGPAARRDHLRGGAPGHGADGRPRRADPRTGHGGAHHPVRGRRLDDRRHDALRPGPARPRRWRRPVRPPGVGSGTAWTRRHPLDSVC